MAVSANDTKQTIMNVARKMVQGSGYNALSFRDIAMAVGIKAASVHYYFPTKGDLGATLARRYTEDMAAHLDALLVRYDDEASLLRAYTKIFRATLLNDNRMCLYGIMAAEHRDLPIEVRAEVDKFCDVNVNWLVKVLSTKKVRTDKTKLKQRAMAILAAIEGAQLVSRGRGDVAVYDETIAAYRAAGFLP